MARRPGERGAARTPCAGRRPRLSGGPRSRAGQGARPRRGGGHTPARGGRAPFRQTEAARSAGTRGRDARRAPLGAGRRARRRWGGARRSCAPRPRGRDERRSLPGGRGPRSRRVGGAGCDRVGARGRVGRAPRPALGRGPDRGARLGDARDGRRLRLHPRAARPPGRGRARCRLSFRLRFAGAPLPATRHAGSARARSARARLGRDRRALPDLARPCARPDQLVSRARGDRRAAARGDSLRGARPGRGAARAAARALP